MAFSVIKMRDSLRIVKEQTDEFIGQAVDVIKNTPSFTGSTCKQNAINCPYFIICKTSLQIERISTEVDFYIIELPSVGHREYNCKLEEVHISVPELEIKRTLKPKDINFKRNFKISARREDDLNPIPYTYHVQI